ncbi:NAD(P)H-binding protein [Paenibacillus donghaensis]|uniref:SDR family oxidoreductase n=1 Tax=Paenibacillus donghaensis TaxID=414771 RepID=UPI0018844DBA|nr:NAD(P)H-binding protein [Paenibacillus donghaensis]MBE9916265.1 NAD(P)H-binding protein [Paenibacillus donghaensis]
MILITGVSSDVGQEVAQQLQERGHRIRVVSRNPGEWPTDVEVVAGDLTDPAVMHKALLGVKKAFLIAVPGDESFPAVARTLGVEHLVFLSSSAVELGADNPITRMHSRMEEMIRQSGIPSTILRPGPFMSNALHWADTIRSERRVRAPYGDAGLVPIDPRDIAAVAVQSLVSSGHEGRIYTLTGPELLTPADQVRMIAEVLQQSIDFDNIPESVAMEEMRRYMPEEKVDAVLRVRRAATVQQTIRNTVMEVTGRAARTFRQFVEDHIDAFR